MGDGKSRATKKKTVVDRQFLQPQPLYQQSYATYDNTYYAADCVSTGTFCSDPDGEACCTKNCKKVDGQPEETKMCCLSEGQLCDSSKTGNPGLAICCAGTKCLPYTGKDGKPDPMIKACQVMPMKG